MTIDTTDQQAVTVAQEVPEGMKPWAGGEYAPSDYTGGNVLLRNGRTFCWMPLDDLRWKNATGDGRGEDVIAYTARYSPARLSSVSSASAEPLTDAQLKDAVSEMLSHRGERPERILRGGAALWETWVPAFRAGLRYLPAFPEPVPATNQAGEVERALADAAERFEAIRLTLIDHLDEPVRSAFWCAVEGKRRLAALAQVKAS